MKILLIAKPWKGGLGRYFHLALQDMFPGQIEWISTRPHGLSDYLSFRRDAKKWRAALLQKIDSTTCDAALFVGYREEFRALKPNDRHVLYIVDDVRAKPGDLDAFGRVFLSDPGYEAELKTALPLARYGGVLPFAHYPPMHRPAPLKRDARGVCFIGNRDDKRDSWLERLITSGIPAHVIGNYFLKSPLFRRHPLVFRPPVVNDAMGGIYARHQVSLNIHAKVVRAGTNMRTFECAGYGIPQVVEYLPGIEAYFEPGKEILFCHNPDEMIAQIRLLLADEGYARRMAGMARQRALAEHTYYHRIVTALAHLLPSSVLNEAFARVRQR